MNRLWSLDENLVPLTSFTLSLLVSVVCSVLFPKSCKPRITLYSKEEQVKKQKNKNKMGSDKSGGIVVNRLKEIDRPAWEAT